MVQLIAHAQHAADKIEAMAAALVAANDLDIDPNNGTDECLERWRERHGAIIGYVSDGA
jgi:hypothetical protein